jgi:histidine triad (HIT) family protein
VPTATDTPFAIDDTRPPRRAGFVITKDVPPYPPETTRDHGTVVADRQARVDAPPGGRTLAAVTSCIFCDIGAGTAPADVVLDTDGILAFLDIRPIFRGHTLVVPREHVDSLVELPDPLVGPLFTHVRRVARAVERALEADGSLVAVNNRVTQSVPHLHVHVVPRSHGDIVRGVLRMRRKYGEGAAAEYARRLREALG